MKKKEEENKYGFWRYIILAALFFITVLTLIYIKFFYLNNFGYINSITYFIKLNFSSSISDWGAVGDFLGGTLNPIFAFLSLIAILTTIKIQSKALDSSKEELRLTREELKKSAVAQKEQSDSIKIQNFENTFFNMLNLHIEITNNININKEIELIYNESPVKLNDYLDFYKQVDSKNTVVKDRKAIKSIVDAIDNFSNMNINKISTNHFEIKNNNRMFNKKYNLCHDLLQEYIGHYFGNIYQILKFISINAKVEKKQEYAHLFRAQLSSIELKLLFYHCAGEIGSKKFKNYIEEFSFFEHLVLEKYNNNYNFIFCSSIYKVEAFGKNNKIKEFITLIKQDRKREIEELTKEETIDYQYLAYLYCSFNDYDSALKSLDKLKINVSNSNFINILKEDINKTTKSPKPQ